MFVTDEELNIEEGSRNFPLNLQYLEDPDRIEAGSEYYQEYRDLIAME